MNEREIFFEALEMATPEARAAYLQGACGRDVTLRRKVDELLKEHFANDSLLAGPALDADRTAKVEIPAEVPAQMLGRYKLLEKIGEGGFGEVWMAEQREPVKRRVALKLIKLGMDSRQIVARFEAERQALAMMDHANIAKIFDANVTETGRPYFVMELVRGIKITEYCDQNQLTTQQRLDLFIKVCQAIQHAHQKGIIHRDIKPSNILVTVNDGVPVPKVIDFGIAKATQGELTDKTVFTQFQQFIGTPAYISPEQAEMSGLDIDTRADIYSLGVLLYELLVGQTPFDAREMMQGGMDALIRIIREREPQRPSTKVITLGGDERTTAAKRRQTDAGKLVHQLQGDLDWIVMKCLEKDRTRRYDTANGLAADLQRHLTNEPVMARPPSNVYRFQKTVRRHRLAFAAAGAVLVSLLMGLGISTTLFFKEQVALRKADAARASADAARVEVVQQKAVVDRKNAEQRTMIIEAARADRVAAEEKLQAGREAEAFAHLARAGEYDPSSTLAAEKAMVALNTWQRPLPSRILLGHGQWVNGARFSPDGKRVVTYSADRTARVWNAATGQQIAKLEGHGKSASGAEFSPDGRLILTHSSDKTARVWDAATGQPIATNRVSWSSSESARFSPDGKRVVTASTESARFSPDGKRVVTASNDKTARVWDPMTGLPLLQLSGHGAGLIDAQFSPDGQRIVTASHDKTARVWDAATGQQIAKLEGHKVAVYIAQFSPDGQRIVTASWQETTARVWDAATGQQVAKLEGHLSVPRGARFSPDGTRIITISRDKTARVWDAATGQPLAILEGHEHHVMSAEFSPDHTRIVTSSADKTARVWDAVTFQLLATLSGHGAPVVSAQFSPDSQRIVTASQDYTARLWEVPTGNAPGTLSGHESRVVEAEFSPDGQRIVTASWDGTARVWDAATGQQVAKLEGHKIAVNSALFSPDGSRIVTTSPDKTARVWDAATGQPLATLEPHGDRLSGAEFSPDGQRIVTTSYDTTARVWDAATGQLVASLSGHLKQVRSARFSPDGTRIVTTSDDKTARIWDATTGRFLAPLEGHGDALIDAHFNPDGTRIVTASKDTTARVWDAATGQVIVTLAGHENGLNSARFSPDGTRIVTASHDTTARVWDAATGQTLFTFSAYDFNVTGAEFSPDGTRILTTGHQEPPRVWDAATYRHIATLLGHEQQLLSAQFSPDGARIVTGSLANTARIWNLLPSNAEPPPDWFPDFLRYLAQMHMNSEGEVEILKPADWLALQEKLRGVLRASAGADTPYLRMLRKHLGK